MTPGETDPLLRRIYLEIELDDGVTPATDADVAAPAGTIQVARNAPPWVDGTGTFAHIAANLYYYELALAETGTPGFVAIRFSRAGYSVEIGTDTIGTVFGVGETDTTKLRFPFLIYGDDPQPPQPATGAVVGAPSELQTSTNGAGFVDAAGGLGEVGHGLYFYQGVAANAAARAVLVVKYAAAGFAQAAVTIPIDAAAAAVIITPAPAGPAPIPVATDGSASIVTIDLIARALSRLPHQYRGTNG